MLDHKSELTAKDLLRHAEQIGMDADRFRRDLGAHIGSARIDRDIEQAAASDQAPPRALAAGATPDRGVGQPEVALRPGGRLGRQTSLFTAWDDIGYATMDIFGGPVETPTMRRIADRGVRYSNFHTTALCSPTRAQLLTGRNATSNGMATIAEFSSGCPGHLDPHPL